PHPRGIFKVQGTKGVFLGSSGIGTNIYIDGISPESHQWESAEKWIEEYQHPLVKNYNPPPRKEAIRGHGSQGMKTPLTWHLLAQALRAGEVPYFDVYDSVTSSAVSPLSEASVAKKGQPVQFPDFTKGKWEKSSPIDFG
ncbi:MAG: gfo/Idh/MocA family oxidoreductase, partial [Cyclobacteriaceae bacterium]|nr:gfo/Idh/MocA family oxidoreductase [Cyclobacteriaceae bacterium]